MKKKNKPITRSRTKNQEAAKQLTFLDHVRELRNRFLIIALAFVAIGGLAYPFFGHIEALIMAPLGNKAGLVYLTPAGAFSFIIQVCMYIGAIGVLPVIIYQVYRFVVPAVGKVVLRRVVAYAFASFVCAAGGIVFAYLVSLPAAIHFLTNFNLYHINAMLTVDSYLSFVMTYLLVGALLFQIPLLLLMINGVRPLPPKKLMGAQRYIILGSFIVAGIVSPTPDALNQTLLASPMIIMYQVGVVAVWLRNRRVHAHKKTSVATMRLSPKQLGHYATKTMCEILLPSTARKSPHVVRTIDGIVAARTYDELPRTKIAQEKQRARPMRRTIDGIFAPGINGAPA